MVRSYRGNSSRKVELFNSQGLVAVIKQFNAHHQLIAWQEFVYDEAGNQTLTKNHAIADGVVGRTHIVQQKYNALGKLIDLIEDPTGENKRTQYRYNAVGELHIIEKADSVLLYHTYDELGRLKTLSSSDGSINYTYGYNVHSNLIHALDNTERKVDIHRQYDAFNRLTSETLKSGTINYTYDALDRLTSLQLKDKSSICYRYEGANLVQVIRKSPQDQVLYAHDYLDFDLLGNPLLSQLPKKGGKIQQDYDLKGRRRHIDVGLWAMTIPENGYDSVGNLREMKVKDPLGSFTNTYAYDDLYQIISEKGSVEHTYLYDSLYNRLQKDSKDYLISSLNQIKEDGEAQYFYDRAGNLIEKREGLCTTRYQYDALNRLIAATEDKKWRLHCFYDAFGRRLSKRVEEWDLNTGDWQTPENTRFLYQGENEIASINDRCQICELRILGKGKGNEVGAAVAIELESGIFAPIHDQRGSIVGLVDIEDGALKEFYRYSSFGEMQTFAGNGSPLETSQLKNPWGFASKRKDLETGFLCFSKRYYNPHLGVWVTPDPLGFADGPNLYAYVHNNPLILFDPYGLNAIDIACDFSYGFVEGAAQGAFYAACGTLITSYEVACFAVDTVRDPMASYQKTCNLANDALDIARGLDWHTVKEGVISYAHDTYNQTLEMDAHDLGKTLGQAAGSRLVSSYTGGGSKWRLSSKDKGAATKAATSKGKGKIGQLQQNSQPLKNTASQAAKESTAAAKNALPEGHIWQKASPFKDKTAQELNEMFLKKGFEAKPSEEMCMKGYGNYINPKNERQYHIDPRNVGRYGEPNHVDVSRRTKSYKEPGKRRFGYSND